MTVLRLSLCKDPRDVKYAVYLTLRGMLCVLCYKNNRFVPVEKAFAYRVTTFFKILRQPYTHLKLRKVIVFANVK